LDIALVKPLSLPTVSSQAAAEVLVEKVGKAGLITLNRSKALNLIRLMNSQFKKWETHKEADIVISKGAGGKAFCAGGDIRAVTEARKVGDPLGKDFFREEYIINNTIGTCQKPYVALIDGITMGGGVGLSVHGRFRVTTEKTLFAMPETAIGKTLCRQNSGIVTALIVIHSQEEEHENNKSVLDAKEPFVLEQHIDTLAKMSPTSLKITFKQLQEGSCRLNQACMYAIDCFVCLVLVDKHHSPKWRPSTLEEVSEQSVDDYFLPLGEHDLKL
uniref:3-hydroxyisobutyryl-CoA hydrolase n=1 Tax=Salmo trutta TaxID=8032 RepID=A0A673YMJ2_SALTR